VTVVGWPEQHVTLTFTWPVSEHAGCEAQ